ncbi:MAG: coproporphyrinogen dehydrogenase HemZ [Christensenellaceae bacterium]|jgi:oxygen-independent coproporphyrinogen-3 oxidase|nr:coproporphyrinogen dehydrogenase HemZ [Christensenellaceae bacterium]
MTRRVCILAQEALLPDLADVLRLFLGEIELCGAEAAEVCLRHELRDGGHACEIAGRGAFVPQGARGRDELEQKRFFKRAAKLAAYGALKSWTGLHPPWGALTGIRPTRLFFEQRAQGKAAKEAEEALIEGFDLLPEKAALLREIAGEQGALPAPGPGEIDLYIGIPFCKTRCSYCSFAAMDLRAGAKLTEPYVEALIAEMRLCAPSLKGFAPRCLYVGGGTPTALSVPQLARVLDEARALFPGFWEFTVEAGRPDSFGAGMLKMLKEKGVNRISVNPQTMNDQTLLRIGREHSAQETLRAFEAARELGFARINMDMILGLPGETLKDVEATLHALAALSPENLTVHTLAIKRASRLRQSGETAHSEEASAMVELAYREAKAMGMRPYYLYRQKYMAGNLENVGYAAPGQACAYNVGIMEEIIPNVAFGAGAISKWLYASGSRIERAPNVKSVEEYIARAPEMAARKRALWEGQDPCRLPDDKGREPR